MRPIRRKLISFGITTKLPKEFTRAGRHSESTLTELAVLERRVKDSLSRRGDMTLAGATEAPRVGAARRLHIAAKGWLGGYPQLL
jgi:hypothetical protein